MKRIFRLVQIEEKNGKERKLPEQFVDVEKIEDLIIYKIGSSETGWFPKAIHMKHFMDMAREAAKEGALKGKYIIAVHPFITRMELEEIK